MTAKISRIGRKSNRALFAATENRSERFSLFFLCYLKEYTDWCRALIMKLLPF